MNIVIAAMIGLSGVISPANATPLQKEVGECLPEDRLDPFAIWAHVRGRDAAKAFLKDQHAKRGTTDFVHWLNCQGFEMSVHELKSHNRLKHGEVVINVLFRIGTPRKSVVNPRAWFILYWGETFQITVGEDGNISSIEYGVLFN